MIKLSITTQKGGTGKSTLTCFLANMLCFQHNAKVLIVDCEPQQSAIHSIWRIESALFEAIKTKKRTSEPLETREAAWAKEFEKTYSPDSKKIDIISIDDHRIKRDFKKLDTLTANYDVVLYDLPRTLEGTDLPHEMATFDYVFIPVEPDYISGVKSLATAETLCSLNEKCQNTKQSQKPDIYLGNVIV